MPAALLAEPAPQALTPLMVWRKTMPPSSPRLALLLVGGGLLSVAFLIPGKSQESDSGTLRDVEGHAYRTTLIGTRWWMAENLNVGHYASGDSIPQVQDPEEWESLTTGAWSYYDNDPENGRRYGKLYNWYAVSDPRGLAPAGWHVPTEEEWQELEATMGMSSAEGDAQGWFGTTQGTQLKSSSGWDEDGHGTDRAGFSAWPAGIRGLGGIFYLMGRHAAFWSSTEDAWDYVWYRALAADQSAVRRKLGTKMRGFSVRCVKDAEKGSSARWGAPGERRRRRASAR